MKTLAEVATWCAGARKKFGDPAIPVGQLFLRYAEDFDDFARGGDLVFAAKASSSGAVLALPLQEGAIPLSVSVDGPKSVDGQLLSFGVRRVAPGLWYLHPSLNLPGAIHAFVVLYDCPVPAPWEKRKR